MRSVILIAALMSVAVPAYAQTQAEKDQASREWLQKVFGMPERADEIRKAGVPASEVRSILDILAAKQLPPAEVDEILVAHRDAAREHGPTDNFGAFVQSQLDKGLRGRELAAAIKAEHVARGKGKVNGKSGQGRSDDASKGKRPEDAGAASKGKRPEDAGAASKGKRPEDAGAAANKGKRPDDAGDASRGKRDSASAARSKRPNN